MPTLARRLLRPGTLIILLTATLALAAAACGSASSPLSRPSWAPAPRLIAPATSFKWSPAHGLRGRLVPRTWTYSSSFALPGGPATLVGILKVPGSASPRFTARLLPVDHSAAFAGYALEGGGLVWPLPMMTGDEGALAGWFPYALPAGSYRLMVRQVGGAQTGGTYDLWVAGVRP